MKKVQIIRDNLSKGLMILMSLCIFGFSTNAQDKQEEEPIYTIVENMPTYKGCEKVVNETARLVCTSERLMAYITSTIIYPNAAKDAGIEGTVYVSYVVDTKGKVGQLNLERGIEGGDILNEEALRVVRSLPDFNPGIQRGEAVNVRYILPVKFKLS